MKYVLSAFLIAVLWPFAVQADIVLDHPAYAYQTAPRQMNGAVFLSLKNTGDEEVQIIGAQSDIAEALELHTMNMTMDVMEMRHVKALIVPVGETLVLEPMGNHIMVMGLKNALKPDESFPLELTLSNGGIFQTEVTVIKLGDVPGAKAIVGGELNADNFSH